MTFSARRGRAARLSRVTGSIEDDAGVVREIAEFSALDAPEISHPIARGELARLRSAAADRSRSSSRFLYHSLVAFFPGILLPAIFVGAVFMARSLRLSPLFQIAMLVPSIVVGIGAIIVCTSRTQTWTLHHTIDLVRDALLRMGRCASCGYALEHPERDTGSIIRCAECGAAWNDRRVEDHRVPNAAPGRVRMVRAAIWASAACRTRRRDDRGRPFQQQSRLYLSPESQAVDKAERSMRGRTIGFAAIVLSGGAGTIAALTLIKSPLTSIVIVLALSIGFGVTAIRFLRRSERLLRARRLRYRICLACGGRLRRNGAYLECAACDGAWLRPRPKRALSAAAR